ncbi:sensor histidine kinase [Promicromonospora sp. NPDC060271]|uniref:sensor histidine kinase n=1 Tax=Promicromonospora sp. NPDC060271 TaxID=3347089 RepID=UPI003648F7AB
MDPAPAVWRSTPARMLWGATLGTVTWPVDLVFSMVSLLQLSLVRRPTPFGPVRSLVAWHRRRTVRFLGWADDGVVLTPPRAARYLAARVVVGLVGTLVLGLLAYGLFAVVAGLASWLFDVRLTVDEAFEGDGLSTAGLLGMIPVGAILLYLDLMGLIGVALLDRSAAARWLAPSRNERLAAQVESLTVSRADLLAALDAERGRIERDLHDGVQQRAVALGLLVNRARRAVGSSSGSLLLEQAAREAELLVTDLRDVAWRVRPTTLDTHGLAPVLAELVSRAEPPTVLEWATPERLPPEVETTIYYVVSEALTNVAKHSGADEARVRVWVGRDLPAPEVRVAVTDNGTGGALPHPGHGLAGLAGRVATAGGTLAVDSPPGGPTKIEVTLPCA